MIARASAEPSLELQPDVGRELSRQRLLSVRLRAGILAAMIAFGLVVYLVALAIPRQADHGFRAKLLAMAPGLLTLIGLALGFQWLVAAMVTRWLRRGHEPRVGWSYLSSTVEIAFPTAAIVVFAGGGIDPLSALGAGTNAFYLIFILLSVLRLDFGLSAFTGVMAGAQYALTAAWVLHGRPLPDGDGRPDLLGSTAHYVIVASLYAAVGLVAGFVARTIRAYIAASIHHVEDRNRVISIFGQHVSPEVVEKLLRQEVELGGEVRHVCVMFLDIRDFTPFAENRPPDQVMTYLNTLFAEMIDVVNRHRGIVNKFLGDGFMAVFGAPLDDGDNCRHAVEAALEILRRLEEMNADGRVARTRIGIGLHAGAAVTGNLGSARRKEYTIIGSVVNVAARVEKLNKEFGSQLLLTDPVRAACAACGEGAEDLGEVTVKGQHAPVRVYRLG